MKDQNVIKIKGYNIYYANHPDGTSHAGSAVIVRENIRHHVLPNFRQGHLQAAIISIDDRHGSLNVASVYCPPRHRISEQMFSDFFDTLGNRYMTGGDWNSKNTFWGSRLTTTRGRELKKTIDRYNLNVISTGEPTHWPTDRDRLPDVIDFFITKGISGLYTKVESCLDGFSDHTPLICALSSTVIWKEPRQTLYNQKTDWEAFRDYIEENVNLCIRLKSEEDIEDTTQYTTNIIQKAAWLSTPYLNSKIQKNDICLEIKELIAVKRRLRRSWQSYRNRQDKKALNRAQKVLKEKLRENENSTLQDKLKSLSPYKADDYSLWKMTKALKRPKEHMPPLREATGNWSRKPKDKAQLFADFLKDTFKPNEPDIHHTEEEIDEILNRDQQLSMPLRPVTPAEVKITINNLKPKKAPGFDLITAEVLKNLPKKGIVLLTILFNAILRLQYFPRLWKVSVVNMVAKPGKPSTEVTSYRPISLLPLLSKVCEKLVLKRLLPVLEEQNVIPDHQFGFRSHHGTTEQIHRVAHTIRQAMERKEYCSAVFLDIQQAFDRVWHKGLLCKLKQHLPNTAYMLLRSYLQNRTFQVKCEDCLSPIYEIKAGVPQGSVLGPVLYTVFTADLPISEAVVTATYADDTAVLSCNRDPKVASAKLQECLDKIGLWLKKWRIRASPAKSLHVTFTLNRGDCTSVTLDGATLTHHTTAKYLGMHLDRRLTWRDHIKAKKKQADKKYRDMYWLLGRNSALSLENKLVIYKSILKPIWTYGIQLWGSASHSNIEILQRFQNKVLKALSNAPWFTRNTEVHQYLEIPTIKEEIERTAAAYRQRLGHHRNHLAAKLLDADANMYRLKRIRLASI
ncbi:unnamed protein product [Leptosia nina]|uniref:Reverse transcriptase domain-containing protein n=1 Tax=Leptosia nina TaxID=320188 RepID=A0AAV1JGQ8_9NEOP